MAARTRKRWSQRVTRTSDALTLDRGVFARDDPRSIARWARRMGEQLGDDVRDDFREMVDQLEAGEMPDDMPGHGDMDDGDFGGLDAGAMRAGGSDE